jgi:tRNA-modifying protein YgfZ
MRTPSEVIPLHALGLVRARGSDAARFLQGQLSNDVTRLAAGTSLLAGYHNPQGRAIALLRLVYWDADDILAVVPRELAGGVVSRLSKFVLRAKVKIADESAAWQISGLVGTTKVAVQADAAPELPPLELPEPELPTIVSAQTRAEGAVFVCIAESPPRWLMIAPAGMSSAAIAPAARPDNVVIGDRENWRRLDIAAGLPQVYAATSEEFVAQMLNLDVLNAIAFDKGCYTGQEVIARAHYRGRVKRRMQRFISREACRLAPGDSGQLADGRTFKVVLATQLADGRCDFLAVAPLADAERDGTPRDQAPPPTQTSPSNATAHAGGETTATIQAAPLAADQVALPYALPD